MSKTSYSKLPGFLKPQLFFRARLKSDSSKYGKEEKLDGPMQLSHPYDANLISSERIDGKHLLMLDIDHEHYYAESSTPGHAYLVIHHELDQEAMLEILTVLGKHGIVQTGFMQATLDRGFSALRMPGVSKGNYEDNRWFYDSLTPPKPEVVDTDGEEDEEEVNW